MIHFQSKILSPNTAACFGWAQWKSSGVKTVLATGCFDLLTAAHVRLLDFCSRHGNVIVGINSDRAVSELKGPSRPINSQADRAIVLSALACVANVFIIDDTSVAGAIRLVQPSVWAKGADYTLETLNQQEVAAAREVGAEILFAPKMEGYSSTRLIERMKA